MLEKAHSSVCDAPPAHRQRGNDCSTISVPTKVVVQTMADGTTALVRVPVKAAHTAGGTGLSATRPTAAIVPFDSGRLHARQAREPANYQSAAPTHAPTPAEIARAAAVLASQRPAVQQARRAQYDVHVTLGPAQRNVPKVIALPVTQATQRLPMATVPSPAGAGVLPAQAVGRRTYAILSPPRAENVHRAA